MFEPGSIGKCLSCGDEDIYRCNGTQCDYCDESENEE